jgi:hypothetical protein
MGAGYLETAANRKPPRRPPRCSFRSGDRVTDETGEYEVIARPYATAAGNLERPCEAETSRVD